MINPFRRGPRKLPKTQPPPGRPPKTPKGKKPNSGKGKGMGKSGG